MKQTLSKNIATENGDTEFQVRILKDDGVGLLTTQKDENYLILDSLDYWYDLIQTEYPKKKKCSCKNEWFTLVFNYFFRDGTEDIREINISATCTNCHKISKPVSIDIDYSPTDQLISNPILLCEKPNIKYKYSELTSYWQANDLKKFLQFIFEKTDLIVYCWFFKSSENKRFFEKVTFEKATQIITVNHQYLDFYFSHKELSDSKFIKFEDEKGVYVNVDMWRKEEIIQLSSPYSILGYGLLFCIHFSTQHIDKGIIVNKSLPFEQITDELRKWMKDNFITKRGKNCFDGDEAYKKFISKRNSDKTTN